MVHPSHLADQNIFLEQQRRLNVTFLGYNLHFRLRKRNYMTL